MILIYSKDYRRSAELARAVGLSSWRHVDGPGSMIGCQRGSQLIRDDSASMRHDNADVEAECRTRGIGIVDYADFGNLVSSFDARNLAASRLVGKRGVVIVDEWVEVRS